MLVEFKCGDIVRVTAETAYTSLDCKCKVIEYKNEPWEFPKQPTFQLTEDFNKDWKKGRVFLGAVSDVVEIIESVSVEALATKQKRRRKQ